MSFGPISTAERLFMVVMAFTTGFTEEVLFRGFAFTRLQRLVRNSYIILTITIISFCSPPENLLEYKNLFYENGEKICAELNQKNKKILATLKGLTSIDDVAYLVNKII